MAYARFGDSDVYVFLNVEGFLDCCGCILGSNSQFHTTEEMLAHLGEHRKAGHDVPQDCIDALKADQEENDNWIEEYSPHIDNRVQHAYNDRVSHYRLDGWFAAGPVYKFQLTRERKNIDVQERVTDWVKVHTELKAAVDAANEHYGTNDSVIQPIGRNMIEVGARVGAILDADDHVVNFLGWGTYDGLFRPPVFDIAVSTLIDELVEESNLPRDEVISILNNSPLANNPRITLDSGEVIWGYQCWWAPEAKIKEEWFGNRKVVNVPISSLKG